MLRQHLLRILSQLERVPERFGIGEADPELQEDYEWSPPNAFHTYWTLETLKQFELKFPSEFKTIAKQHDLEFKRKGMLMWTCQRLTTEIGLHCEPKSSVLDTDQLAWALATYLKFGENFHADLAKQDLIKQAFKCLFSTQTDVGTWPHYKPLFHYRNAGNAYCYVFETFTALLQCALDSRAEADVIQLLLRPYCENLLDLWHYAISTQIPLSNDGKVVGWASGHRIANPDEAESWATASVFSYAQALRRIIGTWSRAEAERALARPRKQRSASEAVKNMASRGETWGNTGRTVSEQLWTTFINPVRMNKGHDGLGDPDSQPISEDHARSAILFGPPGTSKTSLVRALADVIDWKYVEIHASHFVADGLALVQKTADTIFKQLLELDHAVVLFDEIDELVRERDMEKDAFGRFLTTSMLPKLAELWENRKILYFVATNHINYFDSAIIRSHRFDALILVSPPSFRSKIARLEKLLAKIHKLPGRTFQTKASAVQRKLEGVKSDFEKKLKSESSETEKEHAAERLREQPLESDFALAKFALLRYDEMDELALRLAQIIKSLSPKPRKISQEMLKTALKRINDPEWRKTKSYLDYLRDRRSERRDYEMVNVWEIEGTPVGMAGLKSTNGVNWLVRTVDSRDEIAIPNHKVSFLPSGRVRVGK
jgi:hypothetical protein